MKIDEDVAITVQMVNAMERLLRMRKAAALEILEKDGGSGCSMWDGCKRFEGMYG